MAIVRFKAHNGDRSANLLGIADKIDQLLSERPAYGPEGIFLSNESVHKIKGYMEQLRIISDELAGKRK